MPSEPQWLSPRQQSVWRRWLALNTRLPAALNRQLQADSGLSLSDFDVLVQLTESSERQVRVGDLASALGWERSRLSHHVRRMQARGLVDREECADDGRGAFVVLTRVGLEAIERAAPEHVATVRTLIFDGVSERDLAVFERVLDGALAHLGTQADRVR